MRAPFLLLSVIILVGCSSAPRRDAGAAWWERGVIYQIYPRSFQDSDKDGVGDLNGIVKRLDYLVELGVDAIWLSPVFKSPMKDFGYDVADYRAIDPLFGADADFDRLLAAAHAKGLKVLLDLVPNHSSDQHPWFVESRSSRTNPKRNWYVWADGAAGGGPPNNWKSWFGGSGWTLDPTTKQYYYHAFLKEQPDLNWRNPQVREAMAGVMRHWLDKGVDGFRVDAVLALVEDELLRDNPENPDWKPGMPEHRKILKKYTRNTPDNHPMFREMRRVLDAYPGRVLIGETHLPFDELVAHYGGKDAPEFHLPFNFQLIMTPWNAVKVREAADKYESVLPPGAWPNWVTGNHDVSRVATRVGEAQARVAAMLLLTLRGTPTLYNGEELGMADVAIPKNRIQDPFEKNDPGKGNGRDPERTPMQWNAGGNAGFTRGRPWLPLEKEYRKRNVASEARDAHSMLSLYRALLKLRRSSAALATGEYKAKAPSSAGGDIFVFERTRGADRYLVALNFSGREAAYGEPGLAGRVALSTSLRREGEAVKDELKLAPNEGLVVHLP